MLLRWELAGRLAWPVRWLWLLVGLCLDVVQLVAIAIPIAVGILSGALLIAPHATQGPKLGVPRIIFPISGGCRSRPGS